MTITSVSKVDNMIDTYNRIYQLLEQQIHKLEDESVIEVIKDLLQIYQIKIETLQEVLIQLQTM